MKKKMCRGLALCALLAAGNAACVEVDGIAAKVGAETILRSDVVQDMRHAGVDESRYLEFRDKAIENKLILKAASESKMTMQEWVVENRVREIIQRGFDGDRNKLMETLARQKISYPEWYAKLREDLIIGAMRWQIIDKNITASPAAMRSEYTDHPERYAVPGKVTVSVILLKPEEAPKRNEVNAALKTSSFADVARKFSSDSHAASGGVWADIVPSEVFKPEICAEIARMPKGTVSHWIEVDGWSFLLRKDNEDTRKRRTFEEAFDDIEKNVREAASKRAYAAWIERLKAETYIKVY